MVGQGLWVPQKENALFAREIKINVNYKNGVSLKKFNVEKWKREEKMRGLHLFFSFSEQRGFEIYGKPLNSKLIFFSIKFHFSSSN